MDSRILLDYNIALWDGQESGIADWSRRTEYEYYYCVNSGLKKLFCIS